SFEDHSLFLKNRSRYAFLFDLPIDDYKAWARGLKKAGYATDPKYPAKLISLIERYDLHKYDAMVLAGNPNIRKKNNDIATEKYHIVQEGDTLYRIATMNKISVEDLKKLNGLTDNNIKPGQKLKVQ
ncbi:MAG: LysM peptidoglycan-binding domain-containing protein, partial [Flavobacteriaceae bacterium]|nr:LysM peptidoglycan-binding domain-containing protein [Flavobacteriaceae bacterium]